MYMTLGIMWLSCGSSCLKFSRITNRQPQSLLCDRLQNGRKTSSRQIRLETSVVYDQDVISFSFPICIPLFFCCTHLSFCWTMNISLIVFTCIDMQSITHQVWQLVAIAMAFKTTTRSQSRLIKSNNQHVPASKSIPPPWDCIHTVKYITLINHMRSRGKKG